VVLSRPRLTWLVAALLIGVIPTAYASPPDPSWVAGYWDDDDFDYSVVLITGHCAIDVADGADGRTLLVAVARLEPADSAPRATPGCSTLRPRAPPFRDRPAS